jgi:hypothetical protein
MRAELNLESKLDAYEATSGEERRAVKGRRRNWRMYAAAAGSGLAMTTSAEAGIISYSGPPQTATAGGNSGNQWSTKIDGVNFIGRVSRQTQTSGGYFHFPNHKGVALLSGGGSFLKNASGRLANLASGAKISNGAGSFGNNGSAGVLHYRHQTVNHTNSHGSFQKSEAEFAGIKIGSNFGWMELEWGGDSNNNPSSITLLGWAYDTVAGEAIVAGQTVSAAVPEPSTALMTLLAAGPVGVLAWRKRRQKQAATA